LTNIAAAAAPAKAASTHPPRLTDAQELMLRVAIGARMPEEWARDLIARKPKHTPEQWTRIRDAAIETARNKRRIAGLMRRMIEDDDDPLPAQLVFWHPSQGLAAQ